MSPFAIRKVFSTGVTWGLGSSGIFSNISGLSTDIVLPVSRRASTKIPKTYTVINKPFSFGTGGCGVGIS